MQASSILEAHEIIEKFSETKSTTIIRKIPPMRTGQAARQGDIYIKAISKVPDNYVFRHVGQEYQLVDGDTQGSRHIIQDTSNLKIYVPKDFVRTRTELFGPIIEAKNNFTITHPEHAHFEFLPGIYQVTFQEDWEVKERRIRD